MSETIVAISTAPGEGGIGIVRVSGSSSIDVMRAIMKNCPDKIEARHAYLGNIIDQNNITIDSAILLYFKGPASYTGEDMLEIQAHGSNVSLKNILNRVVNLDIDGIRLAEPGEFTKLAFLNGKLDLSQAEAVIDIIKAKSNLSLEIAQSQREGYLGNNIRNIRENLLNILAEMAVNIDYPDEDIDSSDYDKIINKLNISLDNIYRLIKSSSIGKIAKEGIKIAIAGKPNVGKSSLMNSILGEGRAIVTDIPGTTRDTIEESASINGIPIVLIDTAGFRDTDDKVELIGIERTENAISAADMIILVVDGSQGFDDNDKNIIKLINDSNDNKVLVVINKSDLGSVIDEAYVNKYISNCEIITTSLLDENCISSVNLVSDKIEKMFDLGNIKASESNIITNERHLKILNDAYSNIEEAINLIRNGDPFEVTELSVRYAYDYLGKLIGEEVGEDIINAVFSKFCLGK